MSDICVGGKEAIEYFESLPVPEGKEELRDRSLNRIKYEVNKGLGVPLKIIPAPKKGWREVKNCGNCGCECGEAWFEYCPKCGYRIRRQK